MFSDLLQWPPHQYGFSGCCMKGKSAAVQKLWLTPKRAWEICYVHQWTNEILTGLLTTNNRRHMWCSVSYSWVSQQSTVLQINTLIKSFHAFIAGITYWAWCVGVDHVPIPLQIAPPFHWSHICIPNFASRSSPSSHSTVSPLLINKGWLCTCLT